MTKKKVKKKLISFIVSHSIDTTVVVDAVSAYDAAEIAEEELRTALAATDEHAHFRLCDVSQN